MKGLELASVMVISTGLLYCQCKEHGLSLLLQQTAFHDAIALQYG